MQLPLWVVDNWLPLLGAYFAFRAWREAMIEGRAAFEQRLYNNFEGKGFSSDIEVDGYSATLRAEITDPTVVEKDSLAYMLARILLGINFDGYTDFRLYLAQRTSGSSVGEIQGFAFREFRDELEEWRDEIVVDRVEEIEMEPLPADHTWSLRVSVRADTLQWQEAEQVATDLFEQIIAAFEVWVRRQQDGNLDQNTSG